MSVAGGLARACGAAATIVGAASVTGWPRRPALRSDRVIRELTRLDTRFQTSLRTQLESARRYDRRFTLTATLLDGRDPVVVATSCENSIRLLDAVTLIDEALVVLWWNADRSEALTALDRLIAQAVLPPECMERTGVATFPTDGLTTIGLTEAAVERVGTIATPGRRNRPPITLHSAPTGPSALGDHLAATGTRPRAVGQ